MSIHGEDFSAYQAGRTLDPSDAFLFVKATEGTTYRNPAAMQEVSDARKRDLVVGAYGYEWPNNPEAQAKFFAQTSWIQPGDLLACDWEKIGTSCADKDEFIHAVKEFKPFNRVGLYCNVDWWLHHDTTNYCGDFLWIADYNPTVPIHHPYLFWQYSDKPVDQDRAFFNSETALKVWARGLIPPPKPKPKPPHKKQLYVHYRIRKGDTLTSIAHRFHTHVPVLIHINRLHHPNLIYPGQMLKVPH